MLNLITVEDCMFLGETVDAFYCTPGAFLQFQTRKDGDDKDECSGRNNCPSGACVNTPGSYECSCTSLSGYKHNAKNNQTCQDINECEMGNASCSDKCINIPGSYKCTCQSSGYQLATNDNHTCVDVDECKTYRGKLCRGGECHNTDGSYYCRCFAGFRKSKNGVRCFDINECKINSHRCQDVCVNTVGSYKCLCSSEGYRLVNNTQCTDIDECAVNNGGCTEDCINMEGTYKCDCSSDGTVLAADMRTCIGCAPDELYVEEGRKCILCPPNAHSEYDNKTHVFQCTCDEGFRGNLSTSKECEDIDECLVNNYGCEHACKNVPGTAFCVCPSGFRLQENTKKCEDQNECWVNNAGCSDICINVEGFYHCECSAPGHRLSTDNHTCEDINECAEKKLSCSFTCVNTPGSAHCECPEGYLLEEDQRQCSDIDECATETILCQDLCVNSVGSYVCDCRVGYMLSKDGFSCNDINECMEGENQCDDVCINTNGSYTCDCKQHGTTLAADGRRCIGIDGCTLDIGIQCEHICKKVLRGYLCVCRPGYYLKDRYKCEACTIGYYKEGETDLPCKTCPLNSTTHNISSGSIADCFCKSGFEGDPSRGIVCSDIDECQLDVQYCSHGCVNTIGGVECTCPDGYYLEHDSKTCKDIDECAQINGGCQDACINTNGSFRCACRGPGFKPTEGVKTCEDIDECSLDVPFCSQRCVNTIGGVECSCDEGYYLDSDNKTCIDIDECSLKDVGCQDLCINTNGSFRCECRAPHFKPTVGNATCEDFDGCETTNNNCSHICVNKEGKARCACPKSLSLMDDLRTCEDIDECKMNNSGCEDKCVNTFGSYHCTCTTPGQRLQKNKKRCEGIQCPVLRLPKNSYVNMRPCVRSKSRMVHHMTRCLFGCKPGFRVFGSRLRVCQGNGKWTGRQFKCKKIGCRKLSPPKNGFILPVLCQETKSPYGQHCSFYCNSGYKLAGSSYTLSCRHNFRWTARPPNCVKKT